MNLNYFINSTLHALTEEKKTTELSIRYRRGINTFDQYVHQTSYLAGLDKAQEILEEKRKLMEIGEDLDAPKNSKKT